MSTPVTSSTPAIQFASPPMELGDELDADHDDDMPLRFRTVDSIIGPASPPGYAVREFGDGHMFTVSSEEPTSLAEAKKALC
jgi:hypothetical protein